MGVSTDAILFYGYCWDDESSSPWASDDDDDIDDEERWELWEERYARLKGCDPSTDPYDFSRVSPCETGSHCSDTCSMPYVAVRASVTIANRGYKQQVSSLKVGRSWNKELVAFCKLMGIKRGRRKAAWWLVSNAVGGSGG
jgi:hypothetical protein